MGRGALASTMTVVAALAACGTATATALGATGLAAEPPTGAASPPAQPALSGNFGGGALLAPPAPALAAGSMVIGLRALPSGRLQINATLLAACASGSFVATTTVAADGTFSVEGASRQGPVRTDYALRGTLSATPSGTATARLRRQVGDRTRRCSTGAVAWTARRPSGETGAPAVTVGGALLYGVTRQRLGAARRAIVLRVSSDGRRLERVLYGITLRCSGGVPAPAFDLPRDGLEIDADGTFDDREQGRVRDRRLITSYVERFSGAIGSAGARGSFSAIVTVRSRASGRRITRCRSGAVRWSAAA